MTRHVLRFPRLAAVLAAWAASSAVLARPATGVLEVDLDGDGKPERITAVGTTNRVERRSESSGSWTNAGFGLPEPLRLATPDGADSGVRLLDLDGDGHPDVLSGDASSRAIHLWNAVVRPDLGWTPGWSHRVRSGPPSGPEDPLPPLVGAEVRVEGGDLVVRRANGEKRTPLRPLLAMPMPAPSSPEEALKRFRVRPGFHVELVAAEPLVVDPVAFDWDADGRLWVVEMRDYPLGMDGHGKPGGTVKILEDADHDGRMDRAVEFLSGLPFPSGVMPWSRGALVSAAPDLIYAEDTDGDGRADRREVLLTGFVEGNQQHRFNGFEWGLDGWVYGANGDSGGTVKSLKTGKTVELRGRDFRFRPETGELETVSAQTQFGRRRDDWGNWFGNNNPTWLWHVVLPEHHLRRNPKLAVKRVLEVLANGPEPTRVFPVSAPAERPNQPWSLGHVTSGCSPAPYRDELFGPDFATSVFACEPVHNVVHREVLEPFGSGFRSHRAAGEEASEFLASTDGWFRPVQARTGPDGALYVADMYRFSLEHPEWIPPATLARLDVRAGSDRGRLYRVVPDGTKPRPIPDLRRLDIAGRVAALRSVNGWERDMAQRLLVADPDPAAVPALLRLLTPAEPPKTRLQALAALGLLGGLDAELIRRAFQDPHPAVRAEALRQVEALASRNPELAEEVGALGDDADGQVRLQAAFSLGAWPPEKAEPWLARIAARPDADEWLKVAVQSSLRPDSALFAALRDKAPLPIAAAVRRESAGRTDRAAVVERYRTALSATPAARTTTPAASASDVESGRKVFREVCAACHRLAGEGHEVGPDLGMVASKPTEWLLTAILDPDQAVETRYRAWTATLKSGESLTGLLGAETANNVVLRLPGGQDYPILRSDLERLVPADASFMPTGLETAVTPDAMAALLAWLRAR
jgi:putative membrane-bound dehydrogenase-like protein